MIKFNKETSKERRIQVKLIVASLFSVIAFGGAAVLQMVMDLL